MTRKLAIVTLGAVLLLSGCSTKTAQPPTAGGETTPAQTTAASPTPQAGLGNTVQVSLGETDSQHMVIHISQAGAPSGSVTFIAKNDGTRKHEFVVLKTDTAAGNFPIVSFEGESDRIDEEAAGVENVGETGDMEPGATQTLTITLEPGHYALVCNLKGHYRMGMFADFQVG